MEQGSVIIERELTLDDNMVADVQRCGLAHRNVVCYVERDARAACAHVDDKALVDATRSMTVRKQLHDSPLNDLLGSRITGGDVRQCTSIVWMWRGGRACDRCCAQRQDKRQIASEAVARVIPVTRWPHTTIRADGIDRQFGIVVRAAIDYSSDWQRIRLLLSSYGKFPI
jgi:hypothetical protein